MPAPERTPRSTPPRGRLTSAAPVGVRALAASGALHVAGIAGLGVIAAALGRAALGTAEPPVAVAMEFAEQNDELAVQVEPEWTLDAPTEDEELDQVEPELREEEHAEPEGATELTEVPGTVVEVAWWNEPLELPGFAPEEPADDPAEAASAEPEPPAVESAPAPPVAAEVEPVLLHAPPPAYPSRAQVRGWEGTVLCKLVVDAQGVVQRASVDTSSGRTCLDDAALAAVKTWRFRAGLRDGRADEFEVRHRVTFRLKR